MTPYELCVSCLLLCFLFSSALKHVWKTWSCKQTYLDHFTLDISTIFGFPSKSVHFLSHFCLSCSPRVMLLCPWTVSECVSDCFPLKRANSSTQQSLQQSFLWIWRGGTCYVSLIGSIFFTNLGSILSCWKRYIELDKRLNHSVSQ